MSTVLLDTSVASLFHPNQVPLLTLDSDFSELGVQGLKVIGPVDIRSTS